ncbi:MAG: hypothetical protein UR96_C0001G0006 [candidate division WS6 bacterium GW2011_GWC1_36_11]|uniref:Fibronectin type-III domain-containing protein n=2 Tax=Candidatus Dojkabacteria TaxID=74243 RepID=A0A0G0G0A1_9BACT|nr:MAG: hypothetical protein UR96_C0001G0006 [candidate division WS6 bacterium GW2011_GWC1_36_11]KKQ17821.1 MAG: hypothetical protein US29_C0005G0008 [candidate division WS6 bacterium GW2011_GWF1_36_8]
MKIRKAPRKSKSLFVIYSSFFLLVSIPLVTWGLVNGSFDIRNMAFDSVTVSDENPCVISLPNVNPYTLEVGKEITIQVDATLKDSGIESLKISDSTGILIHEESFTKSPISIATSFKFTPFKSGTVDMLGLINKVGGGSVACKISSEYDILGLKAMASNEIPTFTTVPAGSKPSQDIKTGVAYEYTLTALDIDGDHINYSYSFTPGATWLKSTIIEDGSNGKLAIKFYGSTDKPASYLANVFIHDGYSKHLVSQTWVISVSPAENDIPMVRVLSPVTSIKLDKGQSQKISWEASDLNRITKYELYVSQNPADQTSWITVNDNISSKTTSYLIDTSALNPGTYKAILRATDNQSPALVGIGLSPEITINGTTTPIPEDDVVVIAEPQVINMSPNSTDTVQNKQVTTKATIIAGTNASINEDSILVKLDDKDITSDISINKISEKEHTIIYQPDEDLVAGLHKMEIYFEDSNGKSVTKSWTFTIQEDEVVAEGYVKIFGMEMSQRTLIIIGAGILVIIVAIVAPIIIFKVWKVEQYKNDDNPSDSRFMPNLPTEPVPAFTPTSSEISNMVEAPPVVEEEKPVADAWDSYAAPLPQEPAMTIQTPIPVEEPQIKKVEPVIEDVPVKEDIVEPIPTPEVVEPITEEVTPVVEPVVEPVIEQIITPTEPKITPVEPALVVEEVPVVPTPEPVVETPAESTPPTPPEPDLSVDLNVGDDLASIYEQIQQAEQEETPATKE